MKDLLDLAQGYLGAEGWDVKARGRDLLRGDRDSRRGDDEKDHVYVWIPAEKGRDLASREGPYLRRFEEAKEEHPTAEMMFLVPTLEGLSSDFRSGARRWHGVKILVPAQFFDTDFRWERDRRAASATSELRKRGTDIALRRIPQPFRVVQSDDASSDGTHPDLLDVLRARLRNTLSAEPRPSIHIVVGPAGMGKSFLFDSLYAYLYDDFQENKRARHASARPFALLPEHLYDASAPTIGSLLDAYLQTEFASPTDRQMFNWKLVHGLGTWLLDGLDEILERDAQFFTYLEDLITMPGKTPPNIVICVRDSLFATHRGLKDFCEEARNYVVVYQLEGWQQQSKIEFAKRRLGLADEATAFVEALRLRPALDGLASTPYYCDLLAEEFTAGGLGDESSETGILERGLQRIIARERGKGLLDGIPDHGILDFVESCATTNLFEGGVLTEDVREMAEVVIPETIDAEELDILTTQMGQMAVFAQGSDGRLRFAQEPLEHYLAARYLTQNPRSVPRNLRPHELPDNVIRLMSACIDDDEYEAVLNLLDGQMREDSIAGRNAIRLAVRISANTNRLARIQLAGLNLSGIRFDGHVLSDVSFDGADLTNTDFSDTDLTNCSFDSCLIKGTRFGDDKAMLETITFGKVHRFYSAYVGDQYIDDFSELGEYLGKSGRVDEHVHPACAAARQLRHLFGKFVEETGRGRRKDHSRRAVLRGTLFVSDSDRDDILREAIRAGYLIEGPNRERISRAQDDSYREIVKFRTDLQVSRGIGAVLDSTCRIVDCPHVR